MAPRPILAAVDFSDQSRHALRWAGEFASRSRGGLIVLNVVDPLLAEAAKIRFGQDLVRTETGPALREFVASTWPDGAVTLPATTFEVRTGDPATVIVETANDEGVELIVMGTQGFGGLRKWLLGSTTERVLRRTAVPVLAVPPDGREPAISRILAATDFSDASVSALASAAQLAAQRSAMLSLAHVVEPVTVPSQWRALAEQSAETRAADARLRLDALAEKFCGARKCEAIVAVGRPAVLIGSLAHDRRANLIVMGLTGHQDALARRPGSIAYRVLCATSVPVLVVPASPKTG